MRFPFHKLYRAFPELDRYTDAQCRRIVRRACVHRWPAVLGVGAAFVVTFVPAAAILPVLVLPLTLSVYWGPSPASDPLVNRYIARVVMSCMLSFLGALGLYLPFALARDVALRWMIGLELRSGSCPVCGYPLLELSVYEGEVTCPECGAHPAPMKPDDRA